MRVKKDEEIDWYKLRQGQKQRKMDGENKSFKNKGVSQQKTFIERKRNKSYRLRNKKGENEQTKKKDKNWARI
jgi:hypothetical protein